MGLNKFVKSYDNMVKNTMKKNKQKIIESLVDYYGKEYENLIRYKYNDICFFYYIDWDTIKKIITVGLNKSKYSWTDNLINVYQQYHKVSPEDQELNNVFIGISDESVLENPHLRSIIERVIKGKNPYCINCSVGTNKRLVMVSFQILTLDDKTIIHEINHAITTENIAYIEKEGKDIALLNKRGLNVCTTEQESKESILEELINEKSSEEIEMIFHQKGGSLSPLCLNIGIRHVYKNNFYLINDFYDEFKECIKQARITNNMNSLINMVGKDNYHNYVKLVNKYYSMNPNSFDENLMTVITGRIKILLYEMRKHAELEKKLMEDEKNMFKSLSNQYNIKRLKK